MREEFFVELEMFRERIPTIYHSDSNVRLKHFTPAQARGVASGTVLATGQVAVSISGKRPALAWHRRVADRILEGQAEC